MWVIGEHPLLLIYVTLVLGLTERLGGLHSTFINDELYRRTFSGVLLKCLSPDDSVLSMAEVHEGICGTHQLLLR